MAFETAKKHPFISGGFTALALIVGCSAINKDPASTAQFQAGSATVVQGVGDLGPGVGNIVGGAGDIGQVILSQTGQAVSDWGAERRFNAERDYDTAATIPLVPAGGSSSTPAAPAPTTPAGSTTFTYTTLTGVNVVCSGTPGTGEADDTFKAKQPQLTGIGGWIPTGAAAARAAGIDTIPGSCRQV